MTKGPPFQDGHPCDDAAQDSNATQTSEQAINVGLLYVCLFTFYPVLCTAERLILGLSGLVFFYKLTS